MRHDGMLVNAGRRGSALMITLFLAIFFAGIGYYTYVTSVDAKRDSSLRENQAKAQAVAEFATELAMANLSDMDFQVDAAGKRTSILKDWVGRELFKANADQRRIGGTVDGYDYRVRVRSAREAYDKNTMPAGWLTRPKGYAFGTERPDLFTDIYEITAVARNVNATRNANKSEEAVVRTVINYQYQSPYSEQNELATLHLDDPSGLAAPDAKISGEDHNSYKYTKNTTVTVPKEGVTNPGRLSASDAKFTDAAGQYWKDGSLVLNFRINDEPNPYVPRAPYFSTAGNSRLMVSLDPTRPADYYFLGGKGNRSQGYSVTLTPAYNEIPEGTSPGVDGAGAETYHTIVETSAEAALPGGKFDVAVGSYEDLGRLYMTFTGGAPYAILESWRKAWRMQFVGMHGIRKQPYRLYDKDQTPFFSKSLPPKRKHYSVHFIQNSKGEILVREYPNSAYNDVYYPSRFVPDINSPWTGYYVWTDKLSIYGAISQYEYPKDEVVDGQLIRKGTNRTIVPRSFGWEEIQGYEVIKDIEGVPASVLRDETTGEPVPWPRDSSGKLRTGDVPLQQVFPDRTGWYLFIHPDTVPIEISDNKGGTMTVLPGWKGEWGYVYSGILPGVPDFKSTTEPYGISSPIIPGVTTPERKKEILAGRIKVKGFDEAGQFNLASRPAAPGVNFLDGKIRVKEKDASGNAVVKEYVSMANFEFEKNIGPAESPDIRRMSAFFIGMEDVPDSDNPDYDYFDMAFVINVIPATEELVEEEGKETTTNNENIHWWKPPGSESLTGDTSHAAISVNPNDALKRIADPVERLKKTYEMLGIYDPANPDKSFSGMYTMLDADGKTIGFAKARFYLEDGDKGKLINLPTSEHPDNVRYYVNNDLDFFFTFFSPEATVPGRDVLYSELSLKERREVALNKMRSMNPGIDFRYVEERFSSKPQTELKDGALDVLTRTMTSRQYAGVVFGGQNKAMPVISVGLDGAVLSDPIKSKANLDFLPGEWRQKDGEEFLKLADTPSYIPFPSSIKIDQKQPDGSPVLPKMIFKNDTEYETAIRLTPAGIDIDEIQKKYGMNDRREGLGWHRTGPSAKDPMLADYYEYVNLVDMSFIPYKTVTHGGENYLAGERRRVDADGNVLSLDLNGNYYYIDASGTKKIVTPVADTGTTYYAPKLKSPAEMPTFVFRGDTLDGAGLLVVNGNLDIQTLFAYSGILVVLGDLTTTPTEYKNAMKYGEDGFPVDEAGNSLRHNKAGNYYYYTDKDGKEVRATPATETVYRGDLILQGKTLVGGKIKENEVTLPDGSKRKGSIDIRYSRQTIEDVLNRFTTGNERFVAERLGWNSDSSLFVAGGNAENIQNLWSNAEDHR